MEQTIFVSQKKCKNSKVFQVNEIENFTNLTQNKNRLTTSKVSPIFNTTTLCFGTDKTKIQLKSYNSLKKEYVIPKILQIQSRGNVIALRDNEQNVWLYTNFLSKKVNLCQLVKKKIIRMVLDEKMILIKSKKQLFMISWDKIHFLPQNLKSIQIDQQYQHIFQCYQLQNLQNNSFFYFFPVKRAQDQQRFFQIHQNIIMVNPIKRQVSFPSIVKGVSVSKTHALCWTQIGKNQNYAGQIFSWGQRSLALGHTQFQQNNYKNPKKISFFRDKIVQAVAGSHYSLGLTAEGKLYQWGMQDKFYYRKYHKKRQFVELQQEFIIKPKQINITDSKGKSEKIISVKGRFDNFGLITIKQQFYVWGKKISRKIFALSQFKASKNQSQVVDFIQDLQKPTKCEISMNQKIIDYQIQESRILIVTVDKNSSLMSEQQKIYWNHKKEKLSTAYNQRKLTIIKTPSMQLQKMPQTPSQIKNKRMRISQCIDQQKQNKQIVKGVTASLRNLNNYNNIGTDDKLSRFIKEKQLKEVYFKNIHQERQIFSYIMSPAQSQIQQKNLKISQQIKFQKLDPKLRFSGSIATTRENNVIKQKRRKLKSAGKQNSKMVAINHGRMQFLMKNSSIEVQKQKKQKLFKQSIKNRQAKVCTTALDKKQSGLLNSSYQQKLRKVIQRKRTLQNSFYKNTLNKMEYNSIQYRQKMNEELMIQRQKKINREVLEKTIFQQLIKEYIVRTFTNQIDRGRQIKIQIFAGNLKLNRIQKNIKRLFIRTRINFDIKYLKENHPKKFLKLLIVYKNFVFKWKQSKNKNLKEHCVKQIVKHQLNKKIKIGMLKIKTVAKKLQKVNQWICLINKQKIKCLNAIWKKNILNTFKLTQEQQSLSNSLNLKLEDQKTFQQMFEEKVKQNPSLKIQNYLQSSPLFKIKMMQIHNIFSLLKNESNLYQNLSQKIIESIHKKKVKNNIKTKTKIKQDFQQKLDLRALFLNPKFHLLPYSQHSKIFSKLKNYEINILDSSKLQQRWIKQDRQVLNKVFYNFLINNMRQFGKKMRKYRIDLANFIKQHYKEISEKRWKYIIEYNKIKTEPLVKQKKLKQVRKILKLVGYENVLNNDCLPQKHRIIDQAVKLRNSPKLPCKQIIFNQNEFRKLFKQYYQTLCCKAKVLRRLSSPKKS